MKLKVLLIVTTGVLLLSGCSSKSIHIKKGTADNITEREVSVDLKSGSMTKAGIINSTNIKFLQAAADETIKSGYQYFSFNKPKAISNFTTTDEFLHHCANKSSGLSFMLAIGSFGLGESFLKDINCAVYQDKGIGSIPKSEGIISMYDGKPTTAVLDANMVISDLKSKQLYEEYIEEVEYIETK